MKAEHWRKAWSEDRIGFHQDVVNKRLVQYWSELGLAKGSAVFVPLCGKSLDCLWLHEQGHSVLGIELSEKAVEAFFTENKLEHTIRELDDFLLYEGSADAEGISLLVGDYFKLTPEHLAHCQGVYDRAAIIAMPPEMRSDYVAHLAKIMTSGARGLLLTIAYDQARMQGPPFSIQDSELRQLMGSDFAVSELAHYSGPERRGNLAQRGLETLDEWVYLLNRNL